MSRRRVIPLADRPDVAAHLYEDIEVTQERLVLFRLAPVRVRLLVIAELRSRAEDQELSLLPALEAAGLAIIAIFLSVTPDDMKFAVLSAGHLEGATRWVSVTAGFFIYGVLAAVILLPSIWGAVRRNRDRSRAAVWLAAFERASDTGRQTFRSRSTISYRRKKLSRAGEFQRSRGEPG